MKTLVVIPVYNEVEFIGGVLKELRGYAEDILVVDDGSVDGTGRILDQIRGVTLLRHESNLGYGQSLIDAFDYAVGEGYNAVVTMDADGQHEPYYIPRFLAELGTADIVSGSRYLENRGGMAGPPPERRTVNRLITRELAEQFGLSLTDAFCGFKAYRTEALGRMRLTEAGYAMPLELWVQAAALGLRIREVAVPLIYYPCVERSFGAALDKPEARLRYYREVISRARARLDAHIAVRTWCPEHEELCSCCGACGRSCACFLDGE